MMMRKLLVALTVAVVTGGPSLCFAQAVDTAKTVKIEDIDPNFRPAKVGDLDVHYRDVLKEPFVIEGFPWRDPALIFNRLPANFSAKDVNPGALGGSRKTSGGAIRFRSDSPYLTIRAKLAHSVDMNHMPRAGSAGFDIYCGTGKDIKYVKTVQPARQNIEGGPKQEDIEALVIRDGSVAMRDWTIYMPLYGGASKIEVGVAPNARVENPTPHAVAKPVLFYGSSITQGGCASRPGNNYTTMLCRSVDAPQINLGFSGAAKGEPAVVEAIAGLDLAAFVLDYDHNAPTVGHLRNTHENFFKIIRARRPELPVIIMSRCNFSGSQEDRERRDIIRQTYERAMAAGDKKVWFVDGETLFGGEDREACTVDTCHPNDLGFQRMFRTVLPFLERALKADD